MKNFKYSLEFQISEEEGKKLEEKTENEMKKELVKSILEIEIEEKGHILSVKDIALATAKESAEKTGDEKRLLETQSYEARVKQHLRNIQEQKNKK